MTKYESIGIQYEQPTPVTLDMNQIDHSPADPLAMDQCSDSFESSLDNLSVGDGDPKVGINKIK